jgi:hypothetical protein
MKKTKWWMGKALVVLMAAQLVIGSQARAEEDEVAKEEASLESVKDRPEWTQSLKTHYKLSDEQIQKMKDQGLNYPQMAMTSMLAEKSGKPIEDIMKMRNESKMGWGKIAKELGVPPKEIGQSVATLRHEIRDERREAKESKREERMAKKEAKRAEKAENNKKDR